MGGKHESGHAQTLLNSDWATEKHGANALTHLHAASVIVRFPILISYDVG